MSTDERNNMTEWNSTKCDEPYRGTPADPMAVGVQEEVAGRLQPWLLISILQHVAAVIAPSRVVVVWW